MPIDNFMNLRNKFLKLFVVNPTMNGGCATLPTNQTRETQARFLFNAQQSGFDVACISRAGIYRV